MSLCVTCVPSLDAVRKVQRAGRVCVLDIDVQGVQKLKVHF